MSNYLDTINGLLGRARELAGSGAVRDVYEKGVSRTKSYARMAKLALSIKEDSDALQKLYAEIGRLFVEQNPIAPDGTYTDLFARAQGLRGLIEQKRREMADLKADVGTDGGDIEVEIGSFEDIVNATEDEGRGE
jgi:hypothetical protein